MNKKQLAVVHVAKKQVGMTDEEYLDLLGSVGATSSKDLDRKSFTVVMAHFKQLGFKSTSRFRPGNQNDTLPAERRGYVKKIDAILQELDLGRNYADGIAKKRFGVEKVHWLKPDQLRAVMQMLIYHQNRHRKNLHKGA